VTGWRGPRTEGELPTLGWAVLDAIQDLCVIPDGEFAGEPFLLSDWQQEFVLNFYELKPDAVKDLTKPSGAFRYNRGGQIVEPQKLGKGPFAAAMIIVESFGPVLFDGWDADGEPVGRPWATPWIQVTAVSEDQTANVWRSLVPMIELGNLKAEIPDTGETRINLPNGGKIEPVTASARSRLGQRITFAVEDEAHDWTKRNGGRKLADTQRRNLAGMGGRFLETGNAWDPSEQSVAQATHESGVGVFRMMGKGGRGSIKNKRERMRVLRNLYGSSWWVDTERISSEIDDLLKRGELAQAERYFLNRVVPGEDRAFDGERWRKLKREREQPKPGSLVTVGVDGARYEDALAMVATEVDSGWQWPLGIWTKPETANDDYEHDFDEVDGTLSEAMETWSVWRVYVDPGSQYANIEALLDRWQGKYGDKVVVAWLMSRPKQAAIMVRKYAASIKAGDVTHDGDEVMARHVENTRRKPIASYDDEGRQLWTISKEAPMSPNKIDAAAAGALSWEARGDAIAAGAKPKKRSAYARETDPKPGEDAQPEPAEQPAPPRPERKPKPAEPQESYARRLRREADERRRAKKPAPKKPGQRIRI
jgi:phage terminase large subunit-like protein